MSTKPVFVNRIKHFDGHANLNAEIRWYFEKGRKRTVLRNSRLRTIETDNLAFCCLTAKLHYGGLLFPLVFLIKDEILTPDTKLFQARLPHVDGYLGTICIGDGVRELLKTKEISLPEAFWTTEIKHGTTKKEFRAKYPALYETPRAFRARHASVCPSA